MGALPDKVYFGVAGWSYEDWQDTVYRLPDPPQQPSLFAEFAPEKPKPRYAPNPLVHLANYMDMIEINSSFYRIPSAKTTKTSARKVAPHPDFFFTAKLHQDFTHGFRRDNALAGQFVEAFAPLEAAGILRGLLAQFRYDFADCAANRQLLGWMRIRFANLVPLIVEMRHRSWQQPAALQLLPGLEATVANLDYPTARNSLDLKTSAGGDAGYLRLHGRNRKAWIPWGKPSGSPASPDCRIQKWGHREMAGSAALRSGKATQGAFENTPMLDIFTRAMVRTSLRCGRCPVPPEQLSNGVGIRSLAMTSPACRPESRSELRQRPRFSTIGNQAALITHS